MNNKIFIFSFIFLFLFLINSNLIQAPGISGTVLEKLFFQPGLEKTYVYHVNSNTVRGMNHDISMGGNLCQYFTLSTDVLYLEPKEIKTFEAHMKLPQELAPGEHRCYICATEAEGRGGDGGSSIGTKVRVCAVITVLSPYPGKHANFTLNVDNVAKGENATFVLGIFNSGTDRINVNGIIDVFNQNPSAGKETKIITLKTKSEALESGQKTILNASYNTSDMDIGEYKAIATLYYDGFTDTKEKLFCVGELDIDIVEFTSEVSKDQLNPINIKIKSKWNGKIKGVYASIEILNPEKNIQVVTVNSPPTDLEPWEEKTLTAYWDTAGVNVGKYNAKVILYYENKTTIKTGEIEVKEFALGPSISLTTILLFILVIVVLLLIILIISMMKKMQKQKVKTKKKKKRR